MRVLASEAAGYRHSIDPARSSLLRLQPLAIEAAGYREPRDREERGAPRHNLERSPRRSMGGRRAGTARARDRPPGDRAARTADIEVDKALSSSRRGPRTSRLVYERLHAATRSSALRGPRRRNRVLRLGARSARKIAIGRATLQTADIVEENAAPRLRRGRPRRRRSRDGRGPTPVGS